MHPSIIICIAHSEIRELGVIMSRANIRSKRLIYLKDAKCSTTSLVNFIPKSSHRR